MCEVVLRALPRYLDRGEWDKARTGISYCTRFLALKKNMQAAAESLGDEEYYDAMDSVTELPELFTQMDASVYTPLFIPSAGVRVPPAYSHHSACALGTGYAHSTFCLCLLCIHRSFFPS
jgi:hypothetical protein